MPWKPGESGNPTGIGAGRPRKAYSLTAKLREIGEEPSSDGVGTKYEHVCRLCWADAESGDAAARKEIMDRLEGKPKESHAVEGEIGVRVIFDDGTADKATDPGEVLGQPG